MTNKKTNPGGLGASVAHLGNKVLGLEKQIAQELGKIRKEMGQAFKHFEGQRLREDFRREEARSVPEYGAIPYEPIFEERWRQTHKLWRKAIIPRLENLVYVGDDEHGVPIMADFEVQVPLPLVYLLMAERSGNRYQWIREHPYEEWKEEMLKERGNK